MLVALCSKNDEQEVLQVFAARSEMLLKKRDLVAWRINWQSKSENLISLSQELGLSLDSFIFIDDDPIVCAEIRASLPEVLTLLLPPVASEIPAFLRHVWVFDHESLTNEDRERTKLYQEHFMRERVRRDATSLDDFLANLELEVTISKMADPEVERVAELTMRTNQFNTTTRTAHTFGNEASPSCRIYGLPGRACKRPVWRLWPCWSDDLSDRERRLNCRFDSAQLPSVGPRGGAPSDRSPRLTCTAARIEVCQYHCANRRRKIFLPSCF